MVTLHGYGIAEWIERLVLVQRERQTGRSLLASIVISKARLDDTA
jgi:hypothetical protein